MEYIFFYMSIAVVWIAISAITLFSRTIDLRHIIIAVTTAAISLAYDTILGTQMGLYYYITPRLSNFYMVLAGVLLYPLLNIIYTLYLPKKRRKVFYYTLIWIGAMLAFEFVGVYTRTIVFTGWHPIPWSIITYVLTYTWVYLFYRYLSTRSLV